MLTNPPQKPEFNSLTNANRKFTQWEKFKDYQVKFTGANDQLGQQDRLARRQRYRIDLDLQLQEKLAMKENLSSQLRNEMDVELNLGKQLDNQLAKDLREIEIQNIKFGKAQSEQKLAEFAEEKKKQMIESAEQLNEIEKSFALAAERIVSQKAARACEAKIELLEKGLKRERQEIAEKKSDIEVITTEKSLFRLQEQRNKIFLDKLQAGWRQNPELLAIYKKLYADESERKKAMAYCTVEKPILQKLKKDLENEQNDLANRQLLKDTNCKFILEQIEQNKIKRQLVGFETTLLENEQINIELEHNKELDLERRTQKQNQLRDLNNTLKNQIEEKRQSLLYRLQMNQAEADFNHNSPSVALKDKPCYEIISGLPGFGIGHERKLHLDMIDHSIFKDELNLRSAKKSVPATVGRPLRAFVGNPKMTELVKDSNYKTLPDSKKLSYLAENAKNLVDQKNTYSEPSKHISSYYNPDSEFIIRKGKLRAFNIITNTLNSHVKI